MSLAHFRWPASLGKRFVGHPQALTTTKAPPNVVADGESTAKIDPRLGSLQSPRASDDRGGGYRGPPTAAGYDLR